MTIYEAQKTCAEARRLGWKAEVFHDWNGYTEHAVSLVTPEDEEYTFHFLAEWLRLKTALAEEVERKRTP